MRGAGGIAYSECYFCIVYRLLVERLIEARQLQPVDNAIVQDLDYAIDALAEFVSAQKDGVDWNKVG